MKRALLVFAILLVGMGAFAMGREESFGRNTDPAYDYVDDNSVSPTGLWENVFETNFDVASQVFVPHIASRTCKGIVVYIDYMPIRRIEWAIAKNEAMTTYFEVYVISDQVAPAAVEVAAGETLTVPAAAEPAAPAAAAPGEVVTPKGEVVKLIGAADVGNVVKYKIVGRNVIFDFIDLPATAKKITVKIQTADANRYVETTFKAAGSIGATR